MNDRNEGKMNAVVEKFKKVTREYSMLAEDSILVGFSGGADSVALLHLLKNNTEGIRLAALHVNHMIRGEEANRDERFCRDFCQKHNIRLFVERVDIPSLAREQKKGLEECARDFRYSALKRISTEQGYDRIATAHNADDNLESIIFNLARGCAVSGIGGIAPVRENIIRPLISCTKQEILEYLKQVDQEYVYDSTNSDTEYTRNYIRHNILPALRRLNPEVSILAVSTAKAARRDEEALGIIARSGAYSLKNAPDAVALRMIKGEYEKNGGREGALGSRHYEALLELVKRSEEGSGISLPGRIFARIRRGELEFVRDERKKPEKAEGEYPLCLGISEIPTLDCAVEILPKGQNSKICENVYKLSMKAILCFDTIEDINGLYCRARRDADKYKLRGMTKSVKKLLWEKRISAENKLNFPVICDEKGIVFLPGFEKRDGNDYTSGAEYLVTVYYQRIK